MATKHHKPTAIHIGRSAPPVSIGRIGNTPRVVWFAWSNSVEGQNDLPLRDSLLDHLVGLGNLI
jgi:hypothetical protein